VLKRTNAQGDVEIYGSWDAPLGGLMYSERLDQQGRLVFDSYIWGENDDVTGRLVLETPGKSEETLFQCAEPWQEGFSLAGCGICWLNDHQLLCLLEYIGYVPPGEEFSEEDYDKDAFSYELFLYDFTTKELQPYLTRDQKPIRLREMDLISNLEVSPDRKKLALETVQTRGPSEHGHLPDEWTSNSGYEALLVLSLETGEVTTVYEAGSVKFDFDSEEEEPEDFGVIDDGQPANEMVVFHVAQIGVKWY